MSGQGRPELTTVDAAGLSLAIAATRWHAEITDSLVDRATAAAKACGVTDLLAVRVAGAVELPVVAQELAKRYDAVVCLGAIPPGSRSTHTRYLCKRLRARFPEVIFEDCSGGGGRADLGMLQRMDQIWPSDNTNPTDRLFIGQIRDRARIHVIRVEVGAACLQGPEHDHLSVGRKGRV